MPVSITGGKCSTYLGTSNQKLGRVLLMNTWRDACESQQQKVTADIERLMKLKVSNNSIVTYFVKEIH
jgi:hypothetical protein